MGEDKKTGGEVKGENNKETTVKKVYVDARPVSTLVTVIVTIIAMAGLAIGVYGLLNFQALNSKMEESHQAAKVVGETNCDDEDEEKCKEEDKSVSIANKDTIYIGAWGIAISIPEDTFSKIAYGYESSDDVVFISAVVKGASVSDPGYFGGGRDHSLGVITRMESEKYNERAAMDGVKIADIDGYTYIYTHSQDFMSKKAADLKVETDSSEALQKVLTNSENISKF